MPTDPHHTPTILKPLSSQPQKTQKPRKPKRKDTQVPQPSGPTESVTDEAVHKELGDSLVRAATTTFSLEAKCQETMGDTTAQTRLESVSKHSNDLLLTRDDLGGEDASKQGRRIDAINANKDITLVNDADNEMFNVDDLGGEEMFVERKNDNVVEEVVNAAQVSTATITTEEITL
nr:hypothetical protein [Tanacetum cinerariifolium]